MDTFRKWLNKPKADDKSLLARFYHADRSLSAVASELDSFDGRAEPDRCSRLVNRLRQGQDKVLAITNLIMEELLGEDRDPRAFRVKFPEEVLQENLAGQLWFGAECLAAGSSIMNRERESKEMRPLAQAVTKSLGNVRNLLRDQCLRNNVPNSKTLHLDINDTTTEQLYESLKIFDRLFAEFELRYVSAMVQVKTKHEYEMQEFICVLFSETVQRAIMLGLIEQDKVDAFDPALMFSIPRLAIIAGLVIYPKGPLNMDMSADQLSEMFRPFRTILIKIRDLLRTLNKTELFQLEKLLCTNEDIHASVPVGTSSIEAPSPDQQNNNNAKNNNSSSSNCDDNNVDGNNSVNTNPETQNLSTSLREQRNSNVSQSSNILTTQAANASSSTSSPKCLLKHAKSAAGHSANAAARYAAQSPSISSVSADSSVPSTPTASPMASPTPSHSITSASSVASTATTSPADWSDDDVDDDVDADDDALQHENIIDDDDDVDDDDDDASKELDIVSADCASGYLIPNTNLGNLLQPQEVPLTDNFIASEDEFGNHQNEMEDLEMPTTSNNLRRLRLHDSSEGSEQLTIKASSKSLESNDTLSSNQCGKLEKTSISSSSGLGDSSGKRHNSNSDSVSSRHRRRSSHHEQHEHSCNISTGSSDSHSSHHHHRRHRTSNGSSSSVNGVVGVGSSSSTHHHHRSNHHSRHHHHHHHHHHHNHSSSYQHSKVKRCSLDGCQLDLNAQTVQSNDVANNTTTTSTTTTTTSTTKSKPTAVHHDTSSADSSTSSSLSDGDPHEVSLALKAAGRMKFKSTENLLHRLFVCIAGVADQLQTNFASDLRQILRGVFLMNMSPSQEEIDIPEKTKESELFEFRASENDVIQESAGSNQSIYSAEEVNPELDNVFNNSSNSNSSSNSGGNGIVSGSGGTARRSAGSTSTIQRGNTIDLGTGANSDLTTAVGANRNHVGRSRSLGDQENNETTAPATVHNNSNRRLSSYMNGSVRQHNGNAAALQRQRNNSVGSNTPSSSATCSSASSSSSESNSPVSERASTGFATHQTTRQQTSNSNSNNNYNNNNSIETATTTAATSALQTSSTTASTTTALPAIATNTLPTSMNNSTRLSPPAWIPDDKAPRCMSCRTPFTAFRRRHHCRNCGGVFCGVCSNATAPLPKYGLTKAVRVCRECYVREVRVNANRNANAATTNRTTTRPATTTAGGS